MRFIADTTKAAKPVVVSLQQDGDEVNILVNGAIVAWFAGVGEKGHLHRVVCLGSRAAEVLEMDEGKIKVY